MALTFELAGLGELLEAGEHDGGQRLVRQLCVALDPGMSQRLVHCQPLPAIPLQQPAGNSVLIKIYIP